MDTSVRRLHRADRPSPYLVQWGRGRERHTESFKDKGERDRRYRELTAELRGNAKELVMTRQEMLDWASFKQMTAGTPWQDVVAAWREHCNRVGRVISSVTVADAAAVYIAEAEAAMKKGTLSIDTFRHKRQKVSDFASAYGMKRMCDISSEMVGSWLSDRAGTVAATYNTYRKHIRAFFEANRKHANPNPVEDVKTMDDSIETVGILTVEQTAKLFNHALKNCPEALGRLALEAFAGLRFGSAFRLSKSDINFEDRGIVLPKNKVKTRRRYYLDKLPENLWPWLAATNDACWAMENTQWMHVKSKLFIDAGIPHPRNCLRHSFCTYHVAAYKDPGLTATILCHRNQSQLWEHYYGVATQGAGKRYFLITPETVEQMMLPS